MQRDMDLIRELLLEIERTPAGQGWDSAQTSLSSHGAETIREHISLLEDAGFLKGVSASRRGYTVFGLSWQGHEFLDKARARPLWDQAKTKLRESGVGFSVSVMSSLLEKLAKASLGLE
jgi:hypothetical protein